MGIRDNKMGTLSGDASSRIGGRMKSKLGFITPTVMTVFEFFLEDPMKEYYEREVVRKTGVSKGSAGKILKLLTSLGFLTMEKRGVMAICKLNLKEPSVRQFKILVNTFALKPLTDRLKEHSRKIVLFGSCSQGTDAKDSDIDVLVIAQEKEPIKKIISEFNQKSYRRITPIVVNMNEYVSLKREDKPLYENVERGITLWETE